MRTLLSALLFVSLWLGDAAPVAAQVFSGSIDSSDEFDEYTVPLTAGTTVVATLVCDFDGVSRPLDPVLTVFFAGNGSTDIIDADAYDDDGFGTDDFPNGVDCDAFDSAIVQFTATTTGTFRFRADGFGSSTGPYTLTVRAIPPAAAPALGWTATALAMLLLTAVAAYRFRRGAAATR